MDWKRNLKSVPEIGAPKAEDYKVLAVSPEGDPQIHVAVFAPKSLNVKLGKKERYFIGFELDGHKLGFNILALNPQHAATIGSYYAQGFVAGLNVKLNQPEIQAAAEAESKDNLEPLPPGTESCGTDEETPHD